MSVDEVSRHICAVRESYDGSRRLTLEERSSLLRAFASRVEEHAPDLAEIDVLCTGKALAEAEGGAKRAGAAARMYASLLERSDPFAADLAPLAPGVRQHVDRLPVGVVACVLPWNYPIAQGCARVAMLLAAGNGVVLKGSELAQPPLLALEELAEESGLPLWACSVVTGGPEVGEALVRHSAIDGVCFTGGTATGVQVAELASTQLKRVVLELGGKNPNIVFADADLGQALLGATSAAFRNQGQICSAGSLLFVEEAICAEFTDRLVDCVAGLRPGHGLDPAAEVGPLISAAARARVSQLIADACAAGAELLAGGCEPDDVAPPATRDGFFFLPTVLRKVPANVPLASEEVFGPVVEIVPFSSEEEIVHWTNGSRFGLAAAVWTRDPERAERLSSQLRVGVVWLNTHGPVAYNAPWGGFRQSGYGRILGEEGLYSFTEPRQTYEAVGA